MDANATQRIVKIRRDYNTWVADETLEDYALRFTPRSFRKWSEFRVANTALGAVSFLALEAIGGAITLNHGFVNAFWSIIAVSVLIFLTGLPIAYYAAKYGVDMDLLTRGAGFGYIGSTITSLIYASFTFIFFALEAAIMALAIELLTGLPLAWGYLACSLVIIPLVAYGVTLISRLQAWTQVPWLLLLVLPYVVILFKEPQALRDLAGYAGEYGAQGFDLLLFGAGAAVASALITQIGEQVDFLRFLPEQTQANRLRWWAAVLAAGPGWILPGAAKMLGGAFLAFLAVQHGMAPDKAGEPTQMYLVAYQYVVSDPAWALGLMTLFVVISQVKINVTNAYAGSLAWSNFFARLTHSHPGRVVWLVFNVMIAIVLMELGVFDALEHVLAVFGHIAISWIGALVGDLVINKPLGLSPRYVESRRAYLFDINPVGVASMALSFLVSILAFAGLFGPLLQALSPFLALGLAIILAPAINLTTRGRYNLARQVPPRHASAVTLRCVICNNAFESEDMAHCPAYNGAICSLCCTLDARCNDRCKPDSRLSHSLNTALRRVLPASLMPLLHGRLAHYLGVLGVIAALFGATLGLVYYQEAADLRAAGIDPQPLFGTFVTLYATFLLIGGVCAWWLVLTAESRRVAQEESDRQTNLLLKEIEAHERTDSQLQKAKEAAEAANLAKSRFLTGMSHELRAPLNGILGYAQILQRDTAIAGTHREAVDVIHRSGRHLLGLIDGLLDISSIEAGKLRLDNVQTLLPEFLEQIVLMFQPQTAGRGLTFAYEVQSHLPRIVHVDDKRLRQILINLLSNAVKYTQSGRITLRARYAGEMMHFDIEDTGAGIPESDLERIFLPFERSWAGREQADTGTGMGLTVCRMLTAIMGGELTVRSKVGHGSTFSLRLFLPEVRMPSRSMTPQGSVRGYRGPERRLLVVDDHAMHRQMLCDMLAPLGFAMSQAATGSACLRSIGSGAIDLILLDVNMPDMSGWEVCRALHEAGHRVPVIMVSANAAHADASSLPTLAPTAYVTKPVIMADLLARLGQCLNLEWVADPQAPLRVAPCEEALSRISLSRDDAEILLELGAMGYVKGVVAQIETIAAMNPQAAPLLQHLHELATSFRLKEYNHLLKTHVRNANAPQR